MVKLDGQCVGSAAVALDLIPLEARKTTFEEVSRTLQADAMMDEESAVSRALHGKTRLPLKNRASLRRLPDGDQRRQTAALLRNRTKIIQDRSKCIKCGSASKPAKRWSTELVGPQKRGFNTYSEPVQQRSAAVVQ